MKKKKNSHDGAKLAVSLCASLLSVLMVAAFCSSSSKILTSATVDNAETNPSAPITWSPDMFEALFGTSGSTDTDAPNEITDGNISGDVGQTDSSYESSDFCDSWICFTS